MGSKGLVGGQRPDLAWLHSAAAKRNTSPALNATQVHVTTLLSIDRKWLYLSRSLAASCGVPNLPVRSLAVPPLTLLTKPLHLPSCCSSPTCVVAMTLSCVSLPQTPPFETLARCPGKGGVRGAVCAQCTQWQCSSVHDPHFQHSKPNSRALRSIVQLQ